MLRNGSYQTFFTVHTPNPPVSGAVWNVVFPLRDFFRIYGKNRFGCAYRNHGLTNCPLRFIARNGKKTYHYGSKPAREQAAEKVKQKGTVTAMILADKIINLRKKAGWSQEDLAEKLGVSRQSVSKWEGAQSVPDMDKILRLSRIFGVSTDYLLKDEIEECEPAVQSSDDSAEPPLRTVTMEQASTYLELRRVSAPRIALATFLCVISPATLIFLAAMSDSRVINISENLACGIGLCALILLAAIGVLLFISAGAKEYEFLEKEPFETEYGVTGMLRERKAAFAHTSSRLNIIGTMLCILSVVPIFVSVCFENADFAPAVAVSLTLVIAGIGSAAFVLGGTYNSAIDKLLEEGDYTRVKKEKSGLVSRISSCYWLIVTAVYLLITFGIKDGNPKTSWVIWPVAGVIFAALSAFLNALPASSSKHGKQ